MSEAVHISEFDAKSILGRGRFGRVYQVQRKATKEYYAMKVIVKEEMTDSRIRNQLASEMDVQSHVDHKYILRLKMTSEDTKYFYLFMDIAECGNLYDYMRVLGQLPEFLAGKYIKQLLSALVYLHNNNIIHRDIKPENLMLSKEGNLLLGDFGWSSYINRDGTERLTICGTPEYIAPEMINNRPHNVNVDSWAVGILCFELLIGFTPFKGLSQECTFRNILAGTFDIPRSSISEEVKSFLASSIVLDSALRRTCVQLFSSDWVQIQDEHATSIVDYTIEYDAKRHRHAQSSSSSSSDSDNIMDQILRQCEEEKASYSNCNSPNNSINSNTNSSNSSQFVDSNCQNINSSSTQISCSSIRSSFISALNSDGNIKASPVPKQNITDKNMNDIECISYNKSSSKKSSWSRSASKRIFSCSKLKSKSSATASNNNNKENICLENGENGEIVNKSQAVKIVKQKIRQQNSVPPVSEEEANETQLGVGGASKVVSLALRSSSIRNIRRSDDQNNCNSSSSAI